MHNDYSIIIPHHNIPHLLRRCLASIPHREDTQIIVVDDKSDDAYLSELQKIGQDYPWVQFIYLPEGHGAGKARNVGLEHAKGTYVFFADADDFFNYCIGQVLDDYADSTYDAVFFDANSVDTDIYTTTYRCLHLNEIIRKFDRNLAKSIFELKYTFGEPWCKMVKREVIEKNNIRFSETVIHNDTRYSYLIGFYSENIHVDKRAIYCVTDRIDSVSKCISKDRLLTRTAVFTEANQFFKKHKINRFDERSLRPLINFVIKGDIPHAKQCIHIMKRKGMTTNSIVFHCLFFPLYLINKSGIALKTIILKFI